MRLQRVLQGDMSHLVRRNPTIIKALANSLDLLEAVLTAREGQSISAIAEQHDLPRATAYRQISSLIGTGYLIRLRSGLLAAGPRLLSLAQLVDNKQLIVAAAAPVLYRLAAKLGSIVQLGTLENDMVTYRVKTGAGAGDLFTKVGLQLEAYCTAIGKVLLAHLPKADREVYLANGPFPALTEHTITSPDHLRRELDEALRRGFATDLEEMCPGLVCLAVPIRGPDRQVLAAVSVSRLPSQTIHEVDRELLLIMQEAANEIERNLASAL